jgi:VanZ family protein
VSRRLLYLVILLALASVLLFVHLPIPPTYAGRTIENAGHTPLFFLVTLGIIFVLRGDPRMKGWKLYVFAGLAGAFAGFLSEVIQRPLARDASWEDVYADVVGTIGALALYAMFEGRTALTRWHRAIALVVAVGCVAIYMTPLVAMTRAYLHRNGQFPVLADFHSRTELYWTMSLGARREIVDDSLDVEFVADDFPGVSFHEPVADWSAYQVLLLDLENRGEEVLHLGVRVHDLGHNRQFIDRFNRRVDLAAGERRTLRITLDDIRKGPRNRLIDLQQISDITLFRGEKSGSRLLRIHSIRLE